MTDQCVGRTADGGRCPWNVAEVIASVPLCGRHADGMRLELLTYALRVARPAATPTVGSRGQELSVVYYVGDPDSQLVKIGKSADLRGRMRNIRWQRPRAILLATEPGAHRLEGRRHRQFASLRAPLPTGEREWFRKVPMLMEHVGKLRQEHGVICPGRPLLKDMIAPLRV